MRCPCPTCERQRRRGEAVLVAALCLLLCLGAVVAVARVLG